MGNQASSSSPSIVTIIMPAYNAAKTVEATISQLPLPLKKEHIILCDDASQDNTADVARSLGVEVHVHPKNKGYGGNQKTLYAVALKRNPDFIVMIHPDNQYNPASVPEMLTLLEGDKADFVLGNRMASAKQHGMPPWKRAANKFLTHHQNKTFGLNLNEYHSGLRAYKSEIIAKAPIHEFSDNFVFDSEMIAWAIAHKYRFADVPVECYYTDEASQIKFKPALRYGLETMQVLRRYKKGEFHS